jgi:hypothetical protein
MSYEADSALEDRHKIHVSFGNSHQFHFSDIILEAEGHLPQMHMDAERQRTAREAAGT